MLDISGKTMGALLRGSYRNDEYLQLMLLTTGVGAREREREREKRERGREERERERERGAAEGELQEGLLGRTGGGERC